VLFYDLGPPTPSPTSGCRRAIFTGSRKTERGGAFRTGKGVGTQIILQHSKSGTLYTILPLRALQCNWLGLQSLTSVENSNFSQRFIDCQNFSPAMPRSICRLFSRETQD
jgi:hypothetical protein